MRQLIKSITMKLTLFSLAGLLVAQGSGYLAQKLMVENNIRERVRDALSKIVDNNKYVINVDVDLEISDEVEEQITVLAERGNQKVEIKTDEPTDTEKSLSSIQQSIDIEENVEKNHLTLLVCLSLVLRWTFLVQTKNQKKLKNLPLQLYRLIQKTLLK